MPKKARKTCCVVLESMVEIWQIQRTNNSSSKKNFTFVQRRLLTIEKFENKVLGEIELQLFPKSFFGTEIRETFPESPGLTFHIMFIKLCQ